MSEPPRLPPVLATRSQIAVVVTGIRELLASGQLAAGSRLPVEAVLGGSFRVSRASLREAVRALTTIGVLEPRQGSGVYVTALSAEQLLAPLELVRDLSRLNHAAEVDGVARVLHSGAAAEAARRIDKAQLVAARRAVADSDRSQRAGDQSAAREADQRFHLVVVEAAANRALSTVIGAQAPCATPMEPDCDHAIARNTAAEHLAVLRALESGDPGQARAAMSTHLS